MVHRGPDVLSSKILLTVFPHRRIVSCELFSVVREQVFVCFGVKLLHSVYDAVVFGILKTQRPALSRMIVFKSEDREPVKDSQIALDQFIGMTPLESFVLSLNSPLSFDEIVPSQDVVADHVSNSMLFVLHIQALVDY